MMPRLQAEEQIAAVRTAALGSGTYPADEQRRLMGELEKRAAGGERQKPRRARPADFARMGIGVVSAPPEASVNDA